MISLTTKCGKSDTVCYALTFTLAMLFSTSVFAQESGQPTKSVQTKVEKPGQDENRAAAVAIEAPTPEGEDPKVDEPQVLMRGSLHEAFAEAHQADPQSNPVINATPPEPVNELPPEFRPSGENVQWISGYWAWDEIQKDFIWISGVWRDVPPDQRWVAGYWEQVESGHRWVSGFWSDSDVQQQLTYLPDPPPSIDGGPSTLAPDDNFFYCPGNWEYQNNNFAWRAGYWQPRVQNWIWIPTRYVWTPRGCIYRKGYWDYEFDNRGTAFVPVSFPTRIYQARDFTYRPTCSINTGANFLVHMFVKPNCSQYFYGDWYGANHSQSYRPWINHRSHLGHYDPLLAHYDCKRYRYNNVQLLSWVNNQHRYYAGHRDVRPSVTLHDHVHRTKEKKGNPRHDYIHRASLAENYTDRVRHQSNNRQPRPVGDALNANRPVRRHIPVTEEDKKRIFVSMQARNQNNTRQRVEQPARQTQPVRRATPTQTPVVTSQPARQPNRAGQVRGQNGVPSGQLAVDKKRLEAQREPIRLLDDRLKRDNEATTRVEEIKKRLSQSDDVANLAARVQRDRLQREKLQRDNTAKEKALKLSQQKTTEQKRLEEQRKQTQRNREEFARLQERQNRRANPQSRPDRMQRETEIAARKQRNDIQRAREERDLATKTNATTEQRRLEFQRQQTQRNREEFARQQERQKRQANMQSKLANEKATRDAQAKAARDAQDRAARDKAARDAQNRAAQFKAARDKASRDAQTKTARDAQAGAARDKAARDAQNRAAQFKAARDKASRDAQTKSARDAQDRAARDKAARDAQIKAAQYKAARDKASRDAQTKSARDAQDRAARDKAARDAQIKAAQYKAARDKATRDAQTKSARDAQTRAARDKAARDAHNRAAQIKAARDKATRDAQAKAARDAQTRAARDRAARDAQVKAAQAKAARDAQAKAARDRAQRDKAQRDAQNRAREQARRAEQMRRSQQDQKRRADEQRKQIQKSRDARKKKK